MTGKHMIWAVTIGFLFAAMPAEARGRRPEDTDAYPDYNKFEIRKKPAPNAAPAEEPMKAPDPAPAAKADDSATNPKPLPPWLGDDDTPKAPPKPVFMPDDASEPPMPDAIQDTLTPGTTTH